MTVQIIKAQADDATALAEVCALLGEVNLPIEGVAEHFSHFLLARDDSRLVGCVGLEVYGEVALLRSLAVVPRQQKTGLGRQLTEQILKSAKASGARDVVLLTTTATDFFQRHFEFEETARHRYDAVLADSPEWHLPRCSSAAYLRLSLKDGVNRKLRVLILCTGNSARSQMAEGMLRSLSNEGGGDHFEVFSAGTKASFVRPEAIQVMREIGIDISGHRSKHVGEFIGQEFDYVITVCDHANEACPVFPGKTERIHQSFEDPPAPGVGDNESRLNIFRRVRDEIREWMKMFIQEHQ